MRRGALLFAVAALVAVLTVAGTALWIVKYAEAAPAIAPAGVTASRYSRGVLMMDVDAGPPPHAIDRAAATVDGIARATATGRTGLPGPLDVVQLSVASEGRPLMRLVYAGGVLASGAVAGSTPDHLLGLAGLGTLWPARGDAAARAYCNRFETVTQPFCKHVEGVAKD